MVYQFSKELYSKEALFKASYKFIDNFYIHIDLNKDMFLVNIEPKTVSYDVISEQEFINEILIQETRRIITDKTYKIRELMYMRAMASTVIEEEYEESSMYDDSAEEILLDWFDKYEQ